MPHAAVKLIPGVNQNETPALNQAGVSVTNLIRFIYDPQLGALIQKLGGWTAYYPNSLSVIPRALWAWQDTNLVSRLAIGTQNQPATYQTQLDVITNGVLTNITPRSTTDNITPVVQTVAGSAQILITDTTTTNITNYVCVYIPVHISIGGIVLFGLYACDPDGYISATTYSINAYNSLGNLVIPPSSSTSPVLPQLGTTSGSNSVTVTLPNHGYNAGDTFPILATTVVGGVTFYGNYIVQSVTSTSVFTIFSNNNASSTTTGYINNNKAQFIYSFGVGAIPTGTGYGIGGYGTGGYGTGTAVIPTTGTTISANNWVLDNWGQVLLSCPIAPPVVLSTSSASGTGSVGTIVFSGATYTIPVGESFTVSNVTPATWNGTYVATASTSSSVSFATTVTASITQQGTITVNAVPFQPLYQWDPTSGSPTATILPHAPVVNDGMFVAMPQRQIIAWGSTQTGIQDNLLVRWCDVNNYDEWIATATNQAGSYRIPKGSKLVGCIQGSQQAYLWTDIALWSMQYIGPPYVYSFNEIGTNCGLISRKAAASINGTIYWMGPSQFYNLTAAGVAPVPCPIWDVIFQDLDTTNLDKIRVAVNSRFGEISWYYPTTGGNGEVTNYAKLNVFLNVWDFGALGRSAWIDQSVLGPPIGADPSNSFLYQHETSTDAAGQPLLASFTTGYWATSEADVKSFIDQVWPDMKWGYYGGTQNATVNLTFNVTDYPGDTPITYGPYALTQGTNFISPRFRGRLVSITLASSDVGTFWRLGNIRYRVQPDGKY
jgi:hypothetical protein